MHPEFEVHMLNDMGIHKAQKIAVMFDDLLANLLAVCPAGRETSIVRTKLEEASFFAKKAMSKDPLNQKEN